MNIQQKLKNYFDKIKREDGEINSFLELNPNALAEAKAANSKGKIAGKFVAVKANINVKGLNASCASKTLENYKAPYDASVIKKVREEGGVIIGMCNMDEFAQGSSGETSAFGPTQNPSAPGLIPGGTSSGCAAALAAGFCDLALGSDTGGSSRNPASHCGVVGFKPTYSSVSRYGLVDSCMSFDQIAPMAKNVDDAKLLFNVIKSRDGLDSISQNKKVVGKKGNFVVGVLDLSGIPVDPRIKTMIDERVEEIVRKNKWTIQKIKIDNLDLAVAIYYPLLYVEFFSGTRKFDGRRYGKKIEEVSGPEVLRRILGGSEISKAEHAGRYYHQALKAKKLIADEFAKAFKKVDCIISPTVPRLPHKIGEKISVEEMYGYDALTIPANLAGNCAISIPAGKIENIPVGMQIMCDRFQDEQLFAIAKKFEL